MGRELQLLVTVPTRASLRLQSWGLEPRTGVEQARQPGVSTQTAVVFLYNALSVSGHLVLSAGGCQPNA